MKWSEFVQQSNLSELPTPQREEALVQAVREGLYAPIQWCGIRSISGAHFCILYVALDALQLGEPGDCVRINVTHTGAQQIADALGYALPTTKISDLIHEQAPVGIAPCTQKPDASMAHTSRMVLHSQAVTARVSNRDGLVSTVGKDWVLTNKLVGRPERAANYGWHVTSSQFRGPGGIPVLQPLGLAHDRWHVDYSQVFRPIHRWLLVDGKDMLLEDVLRDPELSPLLSDEGALKIVRHPGVELIGDGAPASFGG
jgi:hypothetical protein